MEGVGLEHNSTRCLLGHLHRTLFCLQCASHNMNVPDGAANQAGLLPSHRSLRLPFCTCRQQWRMGVDVLFFATHDLHEASAGCEP